MRVRAKLPEGKIAFYEGLRRRNGDEYVLSDPSHFSPSRMISLEPEKKTRKPRKQKEDTEGGEDQETDV